jgi:hypothetical protein
MILDLTREAAGLPLLAAPGDDQNQFVNHQILNIFPDSAFKFI